MIAARIHGAGDVRVETVPCPSPGPDEVLLAVTTVGLCGSDHHYYREGGIGTARITAPLILGHEIAARIVDGSAGLGLSPGALVAVDPARSCGGCEWCRRGHTNLCPKVRFAGSPPDVQGALAEYLVAARAAVHPVPPSLSAAAAALLEPLGVAIHALDLARLRPLDTVAILGAGPIGLLLLQVARLAGAGAVFAIDPIPRRTELARALGADEAGNAWESVLEWTNGRGVDTVIEATDSSAAPDQATRVVRIGGQVVLVGIPEQEEFSLSASVVRRKGLTLRMVRRMGEVYPRAIRMAASGRVLLEPLISHRYPLAQAPGAFALQADHRDEVVKVVVEPGESGRGNGEPARENEREAN
jgi:L-iditol 2-dehydrogenase